MSKALGLVVFLLSGCAAQNLTYGWDFTQPPSNGPVSVRIVFGTPEETHQRCKGHPACTVGRDVFVTRPKNWDDAAPICQLGHEILHHAGAEHK